jgi:hypothetical protein
LAREIQKANHGQREVERRKLQRIVRGEGYSLTPRDFEALSEFLFQYGFDFTKEPLFSDDSVLQMLARSEGTICFLIGSRPRHGRTHRWDIDKWDFSTYDYLASALRRLRKDVALEHQVDESLPANQTRELDSLFDDKGPSIVTIGASCTQRMLAQMRQSYPRDAQAVPLPEIGFEGSLPPVRKKQTDMAGGLRIGHLMFQGRQEGRRWQEYGFLVAQVRRRGQIWLGLGGLSGTSTYGVGVAAVKRIKVPLVRNKGHHGRPLIAVVETVVKMPDKKGLGDSREVEEDAVRVVHQIAGEPNR